MADEKVYTQTELEDRLNATKQEALQEWKYPLQCEITDLKLQLKFKDKIIESLATALANLSKGGC